MSVTEVLGALGSWELQLVENTPDEVIAQLGYFGHIAIVDGPVDVTAAGNSILAGARYVGVCRGKPDRFSRDGEGLLFWLSDEDGKGHYIETAITLTNATLAASITALLPPTVTVGTVNAQTDPAQRYTGTHQFQSRREALGIVCDTFGVELRVNGNFTVDVGTPAQLCNTTLPLTSKPSPLIVRRGAGSDIDVTAVAGQVETEGSARDYSTRVLLLGQTVGTGSQPDSVFATGAANAPSVPYKDPQGATVKLTRVISESGETEGSATVRAQLHLNRFNRTTTAVKVTADDYDIDGTMRVGDAAYVYDPDSGILDTANQVIFHGEVIHPAVVRVSADTWPILDGYTVAWRTDAGTWIDLTPWVVWEAGDTDELTVGDLPKTLARSSDSTVSDRVDASRPSSKVPKTPTGLALVTSSAINPKGTDSAVITASWSAVTQNTDNTAVALDHYEVQYRPQFRSPLWQASLPTRDLTLDLPATAALLYDVQVRAVSSSGVVSAWSATVSITSAADSTAPGTPSDPVVTNYLGLLRIYWDGLNNVGGAMPADFNRVDVHVGTTVGFTASAATLISSLRVAGYAHASAPYGSNRFVRFIAYDHNGNASASSATISGATVQAANGDVSDLNVGKLTAGIMSADVTISGRFATALTGARVELNALGLQKWDASNNLLVSITGTTNLMTGIFKTALTGRRIEIGSAGLLGELHFFAPDGADSFLRAYTQASGIEAIQFGVDIGLGGALWNRINYNNDEWANYRAAKHDFYYSEPSGFFIVRSTTNRGTGSVGRFEISDGGLFVWETDGTQRVGINSAGSTSFWDSDGALRYTMNTGGNTSQFDTAKFVLGNDNFEFRPFYTDSDEDGWIEIKRTQPGAGSTTSSAQLAFVSPLSQGAVIKFNNPAATPLRLEIRNINDSGYEHLWASSFDVSSDRAGKEEISDLTLDSLATVRALRPRTWVGLEDPQQRELIGFVTDEAPPEIVAGVPGDSAINLYALATVTADAVAKLADIVDQIRRLPA